MSVYRVTVPFTQEHAFEHVLFLGTMLNLDTYNAIKLFAKNNNKDKQVLLFL
jgi:hypothetical protein